MLKLRPSVLFSILIFLSTALYSQSIADQDIQVIPRDYRLNIRIDYKNECMAG
jgi:hypothetical protein